MVISSLEDFFDVLAERVVERIAARDAALISQRDRRGLGGRQHMDAVRRRIAESKASGRPRDAWINGRDYLMTPTALREELERGVEREGPKPLRSTRGKSAADAEREEMARLKRELEREMDAAGRRR